MPPETERLIVHAEMAMAAASEVGRESAKNLRLLRRRIERTREAMLRLQDACEDTPRVTIRRF
jgi:hypothetical protein